MKYMFAIQGEGRGHLTQAISLKQMLERNGHEVVAVLVGSSKKRELPAFFVKQINTEIIQFQSPNFLPVPKDKKPFLLASILYNLLLLPVYIESIFTIRRSIRQKKVDIVINFYELLCGVTYGIFNPKPIMINIAHQYYFLTNNFQYTGNKKFQFFLLNIYSRFTALNSTKILALSFRNEETEQYEDIRIVPPLLRKEVLQEIPIKGNYIHGYLLNDGFSTELVNWSEKNGKEKMHFFWDKKDVKSTVHLNKYISMHTLDDKRFLYYMASAKAYATTAGFESVCEAMYLQKPVLMVPTHIEQECNALDALRTKAGVSASGFDMDALLKFIPDFEPNHEFRYWVNAAEKCILTELTDFEMDVENVLLAI